MTTQKQVEQQINEDYNKFVNGSYSGEVAIPVNIISLFVKGVLILPAFSHKINFQKVKSIKAKKVEQLLVGDIQELIKVILNVSPEQIYDGNKDEIIEQCIRMEKFVQAYNKFIDDFKSSLQLRKDNLTLLSGSRGNGMRIIPQA